MPPFTYRPEHTHLPPRLVETYVRRHLGLAESDRVRIYTNAPSAFDPAAEETIHVMVSTSTDILWQERARVSWSDIDGLQVVETGLGATGVTAAPLPAALPIQVTQAVIGQWADYPSWASVNVESYVATGDPMTAKQFREHEAAQAADKAAKQAGEEAEYLVGLQLEFNGQFQMESRDW